MSWFDLARQHGDSAVATNAKLTKSPGQPRWRRWRRMGSRVPSARLTPCWMVMSFSHPPAPGKRMSPVGGRLLPKHGTLTWRAVKQQNLLWPARFKSFVIVWGQTKEDSHLNYPLFVPITYGYLRQCTPSFKIRVMNTPDNADHQPAQGRHSKSNRSEMIKPKLNDWTNDTASQNRKVVLITA